MFFFPQSYSMSQMLLGGKGEVSWEPLFNKVQYNKPLYCQPLPSSPRGACESRVKNEIDFCLWVLKLSSSLSNVLRASWEIWGGGDEFLFVCLLYTFFFPPLTKKWNENVDLDCQEESARTFPLVSCAEQHLTIRWNHNESSLTLWWELQPVRGEPGLFRPMTGETAISRSIWEEW